MKRVIITLSVLGLVCAAGIAQAQEELTRFDVWVGDWTWADVSKDSPSGDEVKMEGTSEIRRIGDLFIEFRFKWKDADGKEQRHTGIVGYDPIEKSYFNHSFGSDGWRGVGSVTFGEDSVTSEWAGATATGEKTRTRCTDALSEEWTYKCERMTDGKWWVFATGKATKVK
jgi:hypothetical protein